MLASTSLTVKTRDLRRGYEITRRARSGVCGAEKRLDVTHRGRGIYIEGGSDLLPLLGPRGVFISFKCFCWKYVSGHIDHTHKSLTETLTRMRPRVG